MCEGLLGIEVGWGPRLSLFSPAESHFLNEAISAEGQDAASCVPGLEKAEFPGHCLGHMTLLVCLTVPWVLRLGRTIMPLSLGNYVHPEDRHMDSYSSGHVRHDPLSFFTLLTTTCNWFPVNRLLSSSLLREPSLSIAASSPRARHKASIQ